MIVVESGLFRKVCHLATALAVYDELLPCAAVAPSVAAALLPLSSFWFWWLTDILLVACQNQYTTKIKNLGTGNKHFNPGRWLQRSSASRPKALCDFFHAGGFGG
jgi:hypothetical protein